MSTIIPVKDSQLKVAAIDTQLVELEKSVFNYVLGELLSSNPGRDRAKCDPIFSYYTQAYLAPCVAKHLASRAANVGGDCLIQQVLALERKLNTEFHKGVLFHDTAVAHLVSGNEDGYEYLLAMTDEEEVKTQSGTHKRGTVNLLSSDLAKQIVAERMGFVCELVNGNIAHHAGNYAFLTGASPVAPPQFDAWRQTLDALHQFELLRIIHDVEVFIGLSNPDYEAAKDNPFVMLRLAKALAHLAQWVESCLTDWQCRSIKGALSKKLLADSSFNGLHNGTQADKEHFAGNCPQSTAVDVELGKLLVDLAAATRSATKHRCLLRILYIVRNSTAHTIEPNLMIWACFGKTDTNLLDFISCFGVRGQRAIYS